MIFSGTAATYGHGKAVVTATGMQTKMGRIAGLLKETEDEATPLQRELDRTGKLLGVVVVAIAVVMIATIIIVENVRGLSAIVDVLILGVALAVAAVPEGLPAVVTAVLAIGVQRMARRNAIVRHLAAVETLGSASVIASDKTGTLTRNEMTVRVVVTASGRVTFGGSGYAPDGEVGRDGGGPIEGALQVELERALCVADRANNAVVEARNGRWTVQGDPTEGALLVAARKAGLAGGGARGASAARERGAVFLRAKAHEHLALLPALKKADIGVAMGITGTDVSKEAADMVLADDNFATIVAAVEEGRAIFANIRKFLRYLLSSNIGEVLTMFFGVLLADRIGLHAERGVVVLPLLATQILWINLVSDGPPALALGVDPAGEDLMHRPPRPAGEGVLTPQMWRGIALVGVIMAAGTLFALDVSLPGGFVDGSGSLPYAQTMALTTLMLFQIVNVVNARSDHISAFVGLFTNPWLWTAVALSVALQVAVVYVPVFSRHSEPSDSAPGTGYVASPSRVRSCGSGRSASCSRDLVSRLFFLRPDARDDGVRRDLGARGLHDLGRREIHARTQLHRLELLSVHIEHESGGDIVLLVLAVLESQDDARRRGDPDFALQGRDRPVDNRRFRHGHISRQHGAERGLVQRHHDSIDRGVPSRLQLEEPVGPGRDHLHDQVVALKVGDLTLQLTRGDLGRSSL